LKVLAAKLSSSIPLTLPRTFVLQIALLPAGTVELPLYLLPLPYCLQD